MNINHFKAFEKVVQVKSFQEAAKQLSVSQPAISLRIQALEEHFQTKLVHRTADGIQLTSQGETIYHSIRDILAIWESLEKQFLGKEPVGKVVIGASTIPSEYILPKVIKQFKDKYPLVDFKMKISGSKEVVEWLKKRAVDIAITGGAEHRSLLYSQPIIDDTLRIIAPVTFAEDHNNTFKHLLEKEWILREKNSDTRSCLEKTLQSFGYSTDNMNIVGELGSNEAVIAAVEAGLGISVVSSYAAKKAESYGRIKIVHCHDFHVTRKFYFSCLKENKNHTIITAFLQFMEDYFQYKKVG